MFHSKTTGAAVLLGVGILFMIAGKILTGLVMAGIGIFFC